MRDVGRRSTGVYAPSEKSPRGNMRLGDECLPPCNETALAYGEVRRTEKRVVREKVKENCRDQLRLMTYQQAQSEAEGQQKGNLYGE